MDGGIEIDISRQASVQMDDAPVSPPIAASVLPSLWQTNMAGVRAERRVNWQAAPGAVAWVTVA